MKETLPHFIVKLNEIPRKSSTSGKIIITTKVRKALEKHDFEKLKEYVPNSNLEYLKIKLLIIQTTFLIFYKQYPNCRIISRQFEIYIL